ncbi:type III secretion system effector protein [Salmonella bongori]|nr:type III secretion system effector protein [Salmonella bongori]
MFLTFPNVAITSYNRIDKLSENDLELIRDTVTPEWRKKSTGRNTSGII